MNFYRCKKSGKVMIFEDTVDCENMELLTPNTVDAALEKHIPVVNVEDDKLVVTVGEVLHPMTEEHYITMIVVERENGYEVCPLKPNDEPRAVFQDTNWKKVYAYCNLHGLWVIEK